MHHDLPINSFLVCVNANNMQEENYETIVDFIEWRHSSMKLNEPGHKTLGLTTGGRKSAEILRQITTSLKEKEIEIEPFLIIERPEPEYGSALKAFMLATEFKYEDKGIIMVCDKEPEQFFMPILPYIVFQPKDLFPEESFHEELLANFVLHLRQNPAVSIYCARSNQFIPKLNF